MKSGRLDDTNSYRSYMYETRQHYSSDGWFIIGDAGDTVDPLYSHGLALISMQAQQVGEAIRREHKGEPIDEFVTDLDIAFTTMHRLATREITSLYEVIHDPLRCHLRMHLAILLMFRLAVPLIFNGYMWDPIGIKIQSFSEAKRHGSRSRPLEAADRCRRLGTAQPLGRQLSQVQSPFSLNYDFFEHLRDEEIPGSISGVLFYLSGLRLSLLSKLGWRGALAFEQQLALLRDLARAVSIHSVLHRTRLREHKILRRLVSGSGRNTRIGAFVANSETSADLSAPTG